MYNTTNVILSGFISIAAGTKASHLLFHPSSGFLPKTKFQKFTSHAISTFTSGDAFECFLPPRSSNYWKSANVVSYPKQQKVINPFTTKSMPSKDQL